LEKSIGDPSSSQACGQWWRLKGGFRVVISLLDNLNVSTSMNNYFFGTNKVYEKLVWGVKSEQARERRNKPKEGVYLRSTNGTR
jgi:hypothetical protein